MTDISYTQYCDLIEGKEVIIESLKDFSFKEIGQKLRSYISGVAVELPLAKETVMEAFKQPDVYALLKTFGFSLVRLAKACIMGFGVFSKTMELTFQEMHKSDVLQKITAGAITTDEYLEQYPAVKKLTGPAVAAFLAYRWQMECFTGDMKTEFDVSDILDAFQGKWSIEEVFASPHGLRALATLSIGLAVPALGWSPITLGIAITYTLAKRTHDSHLAKKLTARMHEVKSMKGKFDMDRQRVVESVNTRFAQLLED